MPTPPTTAGTTYTAPSTASGGPPGSASYPSKPGSQLKGVISEIVLWTELYECESLYNHRAHFDQFHQWCHSAHLVAFLKRCYRRCGIAGLLPGQRCGGLHVQGNPSYPLVLPTIPNFPYGHGFPLHRVLEYFYGGVTTIVCSITDQQQIEESMIAPLGLIPGQERLNNQCWFQLTPQEQEALSTMAEAQEQERSSRAPGDLNQMLLKQLENFVSGRASSNAPRASAGPTTLAAETFRGRSITDASALGDRLTLGRKSTTINKKSIQDATGMMASPQRNEGRKLSKRLTAGNLGGLNLGKLQAGKGTKAGKTGKKHVRPVRSGTLVPGDPFFWFCSQNFALHTYPADKIPKHFLGDESALLYRYSDFVSRTGTPDPSQKKHGSPDRRGSYTREESTRSNDDFPASESEEQQTQSNRSICRQVVPPAICLCQPTDLKSHDRHRWEVKLDFVDEQKLILGDSGWWPGALGNYFDFETQLENVDRYVTASEVPQTRLLYIESVKVPCDLKAKVKSQTAARGVGDPLESGISDWSDSESDSDSGGDRRTSASARRLMQKKVRPDRPAELGSEKLLAPQDTSNLMLPPLLSSR